MYPAHQRTRLRYISHSDRCMAHCSGQYHDAAVRRRESETRHPASSLILQAPSKVSQPKSRATSLFLFSAAQGFTCLWPGILGERWLIPKAVLPPRNAPNLPKGCCRRDGWKMHERALRDLLQFLSLRQPQEPGWIKLQKIARIIARASCLRSLSALEAKL